MTTATVTTVRCPSCGRDFHPLYAAWVRLGLPVCVECAS